LLKYRMKTVQLLMSTLLSAVVAEDVKAQTSKRDRRLKGKKGSSSSSYTYPDYTSGSTQVNPPFDTYTPPQDFGTYTTQPVITETTSAPIQDNGLGWYEVVDRIEETTDQGSQNGIVLSDGATLSGPGLIEYFPCIPFNETTLMDKLLDSRGDSTCRYNSCRAGCCREFDAFFLCDESNNYPKRNCICNENTYHYSFSLTSPAQGTNTTSTVNRNSGTNGSGAVPISGSENNSSGELCLPQFTGHNWGIHPLNTTSLPSGLMPGDCHATSHCVPSSQVGESVCCLKHFCICGTYGSLNDCLA